jgi:hypothetical protein
MAPGSFEQRRIWFLDRLDSEGGHYVISMAHHLIGPLNVEALESAIRGIIQRHEVLRTRFEEHDGQPVQLISQSTRAVISVLDLPPLDAEERAIRVGEILREGVGEPFDLGSAPLLRVKLLRLTDDEHVLLIVMHEIACDRRSMGIFHRELSELYRAHHHAEPADLPELSIQYASHAVCQRDQLAGGIFDAQLDYWKAQLRGLPTLELPLNKPRPSVMGFRGAQLPLALSPALTAQLRSLGEHAGATLFLVLLGLFQLLLARYSRQQDIVVGIPISGRSQMETVHPIGRYSNTLVLRGDVSNNPSFREVLKRVRDVWLGACAHQDVPFELLVDELQPKRDLSRHPLFQVMLVLQDASEDVLELVGLKVHPVELCSNISKYDLTLLIQDTSSGVRGFFEYNTDLFEEATIEGMAESFVVLAESAVAAPDRPIGQLACLPKEAYRQLLYDWNDTVSAYPGNRCVHELFEEQVVRSPSVVAVEQSDLRLSYHELNASANRIGWTLRGLGVGPEVVVALCLERSPDMVVAMLGVLKAGGPICPSIPTIPKSVCARCFRTAEPVC